MEKAVSALVRRVSPEKLGWLPYASELRHEHTVHIKGYSFRSQYKHLMSEAMNGTLTLRYVYFNTRSKKWMIVAVFGFGKAEAITEDKEGHRMTALGFASELSGEAIKYVTGKKNIEAGRL